MKSFIYLMICLTFCSELIHCSCLSYGHSCWGAHGKRSSNDLSNNEQKADRWAVFRAIQDQTNDVAQREQNNELSRENSMEYVDANALTFIYSKIVGDILPVREKPKSYPLYRKRLINQNSENPLHIKTAKPIPLALSKYMTVSDTLN